MSSATISAPEIASDSTVVLLLQPLVSAGAVPCHRLLVLRSETVANLRLWLRRALGSLVTAPIYIYVIFKGRRFAPSADECLGSIAAVFGGSEGLILGYSLRAV